MGFLGVSTGRAVIQPLLLHTRKFQLGGINGSRGYQGSSLAFPSAGSGWSASSTGMQIAVVPKYKEYALRSAIRSYSAAAVVKERKSTKTVPPTTAARPDEDGAKALSTPAFESYSQAQEGRATEVNTTSAAVLTPRPWVPILAHMARLEEKTGTKYSWAQAPLELRTYITARYPEVTCDDSLKRKSLELYSESKRLGRKLRTEPKETWRCLQFLFMHVRTLRTSRINADEVRRRRESNASNAQYLQRMTSKNASLSRKDLLVAAEKGTRMKVRCSACHTIQPTDTKVRWWATDVTVYVMRRNKCLACGTPQYMRPVDEQRRAIKGFLSQLRREILPGEVIAAQIRAVEQEAAQNASSQ